MIATSTTKPIVGPATQSPEWHAMRKFDPSRTERPVVFGASEAAAACGRSKYSSALELYLRKRGEIDDIESNEAMAMGNRLEPVILDMYEERIGKKIVRKLPMFFSREFEFMAATPDGMDYYIHPALPLTRFPTAWDEFDFTTSIDAKASTGRRFDATGEDMDSFGVDGSDQVPIEYLLQGQQQCAVMGVSRVDFPVLFDGRQLRVYSVARDEDLIAEIFSAEKELAERIINGDPPEPDFQHSGTLKLLQKMHGCEVGKVITWSDDLAAKWARLEKVKKVAASLKEREDVLKAELFHAMGDAELAVCGPLTVKRVNVKATSFVTEKKAYSYLKACKTAK